MTYYFRYALFRLREPWTDFFSSLSGYVLYGFFIILLAGVWQRFQSTTSLFSKPEIILYIGITEMLFMSFIRGRSIQSGMEDFALFLAKPRSWIGREFFGNAGFAMGQRLAYLLALALLVPFVGAVPASVPQFVLRVAFLLAMLAVPQALLSTLLSSLRLSFPQTDYFILPFSKLFLSFGGVFAPLSDFGEPLRSLFLRLPGSDLFFQAAYFAVKGEFYEMSFNTWCLRIFAINLFLYLCLLYFYRTGKRRYQAWGG